MGVWLRVHTQAGLLPRTICTLGVTSSCRQEKGMEVRNAKGQVRAFLIWVQVISPVTWEMLSLSLNFRGVTLGHPLNGSQVQTERMWWTEYRRPMLCQLLLISVIPTPSWIWGGWVWMNIQENGPSLSLHRTEVIFCLFVLWLKMCFVSLEIKLMWCWEKKRKSKQDLGEEEPQFQRLVSF